MLPLPFLNASVERYSKRCSLEGLARVRFSLIGRPSVPAALGCRDFTSRASQGQDKPPRAASHNPPIGAGTAGKLLTINKHRCAIIMGCLLRYQDGLSSPICQFKKHCGPGGRGEHRPTVERGYAIEGPGTSLSGPPAVWD